MTTGAATGADQPNTYWDELQAMTAGGSAVSELVVGSTAIVGPPTAGSWKTNQSFVDSNGAIWVCGTGGNPGSNWFQGGSGVELAEAELSSDFAMSGTGPSDVTGLSVTFTAPARAFILDLSVAKLTVSASTAWGYFQVTDSANVPVGTGFYGSMSAITIAPPVIVRARLPRTGGAAYAISPGTSYTFKARFSCQSGTGTIATDGGAERPILRAVTC